jgi:hypothetical protein
MALFNWRREKKPIARPVTEGRKVPLTVEALEDRLVPTVYNVAAGDVATLIADINQANSNGQSNTINLSPGTYDLKAADNYWYGPNGLPAITSNLTIQGNGAILERDPALGTTTPFRLLFVSGGLTGGLPAGNLTLENLTLEGGLAQGGNSGTGGGGLGAGGAVFNQGTLTLNGVTVDQNTAEGGNSNTGSSTGGGGIGQDAQGINGGGFGGLTSLGKGGQGGLGGNGSSQSGGGGGGGFNQNGQSAQTGAGIGGGYSGFGGAGGNGAAGGDGGGGGGGVAGGGGGLGGSFGFGGGGSYSGGGGGGGVGGGGGSGTALVGMSDNSGGGGGFGGGGASGSLAGGSGGFGGGGGTGGLAGGAEGWGGGAGGTGGGGGGAGLGGAIFNLYGSTTLINSTLTANTASGGSAAAGSSGGDGFGGAVFNLDGSVTVTSSTLASNTVEGAATDGGALYNLSLGRGPAGAPRAAAVTLSDSILANSAGGNDLVNDQFHGALDVATVNTTAPNIIMTLNTINGATTNGTPIVSNPQLGPLANNGGPTLTMLPQPGSAAFKAGVTGTGIPTTDQRGNTRGNVVDLGAVQVSIVDPNTTVTTISAGSTNVQTGQTVTVTVTVNPGVTGGTTPAGTVSFVDTTTNANLGTATLTVGSNGLAQATLTVTLAAGSHSIQATYLSSNGLDTSSASTTVLVATANQLWLSQIYQDLLGRPIDPTGMAYWTAVLNAGTTKAQVTNLLVNSTEYKADQVKAAFQTFLHRPADQPSLIYFVSLMNQGMSIEQVQALIAGSTEYFLGRAGNSNTGFLTAVFQDILHRPIDPGSLQTLQGMLTSGTSRIQIALDLMNTTEYKTDLIQNAYQQYVQTTAGPAVISALLSLQSGGASADTVIAAVLASPAYQARALV